jgi:hypothetical protein
MARYFTVSRFADLGLLDGELTRLPTSLAHAKQMGTLFTVCGQEASSWQRMWDVPFGAGGRRLCPDCVLTLRSQAS